MKTYTTGYGTTVTKFNSHKNPNNDNKLTYWRIFERPNKPTLIGYSYRENGLIKEVQNISKQQTIELYGEEIL